MSSPAARNAQGKPFGPEEGGYLPAEPEKEGLHGRFLLMVCITLIASSA